MGMQRMCKINESKSKQKNHNTMDQKAGAGEVGNWGQEG